MGRGREIFRRVRGRLTRRAPPRPVEPEAHGREEDRTSAGLARAWEDAFRWLAGAWAEATGPLEFAVGTDPFLAATGAVGRATMGAPASFREGLAALRSSGDVAAAAAPLQRLVEGLPEAIAAAFTGAGGAPAHVEPLVAVVRAAGEDLCDALARLVGAPDVESALLDALEAWRSALGEGLRRESAALAARLGVDPAPGSPVSGA